MNDIHGRGADGRGNTPSVADVGGAAGPREGSDPTSGDDASGDASGARMGGSDPVDVACAKVDPVMIRVVEFLREAQEFFRLSTADERADAAASLVDEVVAWAEELRTATLDVAAHVNGIESLKDTVVANANQLQDDILRAYKAAWEAGGPCPFCFRPTSRVPPFCEHVAEVCPFRRTTVGGSDPVGPAWRRTDAAPSTGKATPTRRRELDEVRGRRSIARSDRFERALINIALGDVHPREEASLALRDVFAPLTSPPAGDPHAGDAKP